MRTPGNWFGLKYRTGLVAELFFLCAMSDTLYRAAYGKSSPYAASCLMFSCHEVMIPPMKHELFFDLQKELTTNVDFNNKVTALMKNIFKADKEGKTEDVKYNVSELLKLCDFNPSLLVPYFFPNFADSKPMSLLSRPHAIGMMAFIPNGTLVVNASRQIGKCVAGKSKIRVRDANGEREMTMQELFDEENKPV